MQFPEMILQNFFMKYLEGVTNKDDLARFSGEFWFNPASKQYEIVIKFIDGKRPRRAVTLVLPIDLMPIVPEGSVGIPALDCSDNLKALTELPVPTPIPLPMATSWKATETQSVPDDEADADYWRAYCGF